MTTRFLDRIADLERQVRMRDLQIEGLEIELRRMGRLVSDLRAGVRGD